VIPRNLIDYHQINNPTRTHHRCLQLLLPKNQRVNILILDPATRIAADHLDHLIDQLQTTREIPQLAENVALLENGTPQHRRELAVAYAVFVVVAGY